MAKTQIQDVIVPALFAPYVINRTAELSALWASGIVAPVDAQLGIDITSGGNQITLPFWNDLTGEEEILSDADPLSTDKITSAKDIAVLHFRGKAWSANDLSAQLSGSDPMAAIGNLVAAYWARRFQACLIATLKGAFGAASMSANVHDISAGTGDSAAISGVTFLDAAQKLGDAKGILAAVAMHSATETALAKKDLIETIPASEGKPEIKTFQGKRVIVDDGMPNSGGVFTSYLFATGAVGYKAGQPKVAVETDRDSLAGDDILINRQAFILHPRGVMWKGSAAGVSPKNSELEAAASWERVFEPKQIRIVQFKHKLAA